MNEEEKSQIVQEYFRQSHPETFSVSLKNGTSKHYFSFASLFSRTGDCEDKEAYQYFRRHFQCALFILFLEISFGLLSRAIYCLVRYFYSKDKDAVLKALDDCSGGS